ncbi:alpha/beta hydrolase [Achromobacter seleniivolatilans]|uniref:Alpha/beta hydrolase n=1 Tax=Achromobacter seleniivolatilans TaxID=3047478 RepID=A0ABY9M4S9_9BURK|nr:alpha/beta hydrolase [Achromobacter sp. R39]WMD21633.1 alpha/beta hydrolase [Achromobacter sp. R39]
MILLLAGCAMDRVRNADELAAPSGLHREHIATGTFVLTAYTRIPRADRPLRVYIEGDGLAWITRTQPSADPTPRNAVGLTLAAQDASDNVAYLARPCQFTPMSLNPQCTPVWWTGKRFGIEIVNAMNAAIDRLAARAPGQRVELIGYSGGGALAVLLAARRHDVASIRTVAGNLDTEFVNQLHEVSAMPESLNPINEADRVAAIPQLHISGANDKIVPPSVAARFASATGPRCVRTRTLNGLDHGGNWAAQWPALLSEAPVCSDQK